MRIKDYLIGAFLAIMASLTFFEPLAYAYRRYNVGISPFLIPFLLFLVITFIIVLILREFYCWYLKINERITLQKETNSLLQNILKITNAKKEISPPLVPKPKSLNKKP